MTYTATCNCLQLIEKLPHGVLKYSYDVEGLVETSQSVAVGKLVGEFFNVITDFESIFNDVNVNLPPSILMG